MVLFGVVGYTHQRMLGARIPKATFKVSDLDSSQVLWLVCTFRFLVTSLCMLPMPPQLGTLRAARKPGGYSLANFVHRFNDGHDFLEFGSVSRGSSK